MPWQSRRTMPSPTGRCRLLDDDYVKYSPLHELLSISLMRPNVKLSNLAYIIVSIHLPMNDSRIIFNVDVNAVCRRSFATEIGKYVLGIRTTFAIFQGFGTVACWTDDLKMWQIGSESANVKSHRNQFGILSGPADFRILIAGKKKTSYGCVVAGRQYR